MSKKIQPKFIEAIKRDNILIAKIAKELKKTVTTVSRNYLYGRNDEALLNVNVLDIIIAHLQIKKVKERDDLLYNIVDKSVNNNTKNVPIT